MRMNKFGVLVIVVLFASLMSLALTIGCGPTDAQVREKAFLSCTNTFIIQVESRLSSLDQSLAFHPSGDDAHRWAEKFTKDTERMPDARHKFDCEKIIGRMELICGCFKSIGDVLDLAKQRAPLGELKLPDSTLETISNIVSLIKQDIEEIKEIQDHPSNY